MLPPLPCPPLLLTPQAGGDSEEDAEGPEWAPRGGAASGASDEEMSEGGDMSDPDVDELAAAGGCQGRACLWWRRPVGLPASPAVCTVLCCAVLPTHGPALKLSR